MRPFRDGLGLALSSAARSARMRSSSADAGSSLESTSAMIAFLNGTDGTRLVVD